MRRTASEIIRNLEMRIARLEKQSQQKIAIDGTDYKTLTTAYDDELQSFESLRSVLSSARNREVMSLKVFLKCLSLKRANNLALKLSKKRNIKGWESDREVLTYAQMMKTKYGTKGIGRIFTMIADDLNLKRLKQVLKSVKLLTPLYDADDFMSLWDLILGSNGVSLDVLSNLKDVESKDEKVIHEGDIGVANYGGGDVYGTEIDVVYEETGSFTIPLGVNTDQFNEDLVYRLSELLDEEILKELEGKDSVPSLYDFEEHFNDGRMGELSCSVDISRDKIVGDYSIQYTETVNVDEYYSEY